MKLIPKNWGEFQHYKDRSPTWIKLHKALLDDFRFHSLPLASRALAPMLWLLASESKDGEIDASFEEIGFRLRMPESDVERAIKPLIDKGFFIVASGVLADCKPDASLEKRHIEQNIDKTEKELPSKFSVSEFDQFWNAYPRKIGKGAALKAWKSAIKKTSPETLLAAVTAHGEHWRTEKTESEFIPHPATWLNGERWSDSLEKPKKFDVKAYMAELEERDNVGS